MAIGNHSLVGDPRGSHSLTAPERLLKLKEIADIVGVDQRTLHCRIASGGFPPADLRSGCRIVRWRASTVQFWIDARGDRHDAQVAASRRGPAIKPRGQNRRIG